MSRFHKQQPIIGTNLSVNILDCNIQNFNSRCESR